MPKGKGYPKSGGHMMPAPKDMPHKRPKKMPKRMTPKH